MNLPSDPAVKAAFDAFPEAERRTLLNLRRLVFAVAETDPRIGPLTETLKWGQPSYLTRPRVGTTLRLGSAGPGTVALYCHCQTRVIADFQMAHPTAFSFENNRGAHLPTDADLSDPALAALIHSALTYHLPR